MERQLVLDTLSTQMRTIVRGIGDRPIREEDSLVTGFGADSLQVVEILSRTMRQLGVKVRRTELSTARNIGELVTLFTRAAPPAGAA